MIWFRGMLCGSQHLHAHARVRDTSIRQHVPGRLLQPSLRKKQLCPSPRLQCLNSAKSRKSACATFACSQATAAVQPVGTKKACTYDVIALGNLCLDIFVSVPELPSTEVHSRQRLLSQLTASPPSRAAWEVGGNTNFMIAAARLGMQVAPVGHLGPDEYGQYIKDVLQVSLILVTQFCSTTLQHKSCAGAVAEIAAFTQLGSMVAQVAGHHCSFAELLSVMHLKPSAERRRS